MYKVSATCDRAAADHLSDVLANLDPSPAAAVSVEEVSRITWRLEVTCQSEEEALACVDIIAAEANGLSASHLKIPDMDWVAESLRGLPAVQAGPYYVAGEHELARRQGGTIPIWIEAGPAFGTGHHGTTKGCLEALAEVANRKKLGKVLDIGTGSGVLAIAAIKSGAEMAIASDIDDESIRMSKVNAANNHVGRKLHLLVATGANNSFIRSQGPYDTILANILARPLVSLASDITKLTKPGGYIILSGLLTHQEPQVKTAFSGRNLALMDRKRLGPWSTLVYRKPLQNISTQSSVKKLNPTHFDIEMAEYFGF